MHNSDDDYDDFQFTEQELASIDEAVQRATTQRPANANPSFTRETPPPAKRQKISHARNSPPSEPTPSRENYEMTEIIVQDDGSFLAHVPTPAGSHRPENRPFSSVNRRPVSRTSSTPSAEQGVAISHAAQGSKLRPQPGNRGNPQGTRHLERRFSPLPDRERRPTSAPISRTDSVIQSARQTNSATNRSEELDQLRQEIENLRAKWEQEREEKEVALKERNEERDGRLAKTGEVSILRTSMENVAQENITKFEKLKSAKEASEAEVKKLQKALREERERSRTQLMFKQQEITAASFRSPWNPRTAKANPQNSPVPFPSQLRPGPQAKTPRKPIHGDPLSPLQARTRISSATKPPTLPGYHNAFEVTSPINIRKKGKQRETRFEEDSNVFLDVAPPSSPTPAPATRSRREEIQSAPDADVSMEDIIPDPSPEDPATSQINDDEDMMGGDQEIIPGPDELAPIEPVIWKDVVYDIICGHGYTFNGRECFTTQRLLGILHELEPSLQPSTLSQYSMTCNRFLDALRATSKVTDEDAYLSTISESLVTFVAVFNTISSIPALSALLNLLQELSSSVYPFAKWLLTSPLTDGHSPPPIIPALCETVLSQLDPDKETPEDILSPFVKELFSFINILAYRVDGDLALALGAIPRAQGVMSILLSPRHPLWLLQRTTRTLSILSSHLELFQDFLVVPTPATEAPHSSGPISNHKSIPQIEQMARFLRDDRLTSEAIDMKTSILTFIGTMCVAHQDALAALVQSPGLVPALVLFLSNIATPFWDEDDDLCSSPELLERHFSLMISTTLLLHRILHCQAPKYDIARLHALNKPTKSRTFSGLIDKCTINFSRLAFADAPFWAEPAMKERLEQVSEVARDLLGLFHDDPALESLWSVYQFDADVVKRAAQVEDEDEAMLLPHSPSV